MVGDDVAVAGASRLAVFKMNADQIKKTMPILDDMIAFDKGLNGTQEDAIAIGELYGKAINGKVNALKKYGVVLTANEEKLFKVMSTEQRIEFINKKLEKSIGGTNKALRATDEGKIVAMKGAWGDMQAELGKKLMPKLGNLAEWFHSKIPTIQDFILSLADKVEEMVIKAEPYITEVKELLGKMFEKIKPALDEVWDILEKAGSFAIWIAKDIKDNWDWIGPIVTGVAVAFGVYKTAIMLASAKTLLFNGVMVVTNFLLTANPIGLVVVAIGALIGVVIALYKNWDKIKVKLKELWNVFKEVIIACWEVVKGCLLPIWEAVVNVFIFVKDVIVGLCKVIGGIFTAVWDGVISALDKLKAGFNKVTDFITGVFQSAWDSLMNALDMVLHPIETAKKAFEGLIDKLKFWNNTKAEDKTININEVKKTDNIGGSNKTGITTTTVKNPRHALGTAYFKGGVTGINEGGRNETAILPAGTQILSHEQGKAINNKTTKGITININVNGNIIGEREHMDKYGDYITNKILSSLGNM